MGLDILSRVRELQNEIGHGVREDVLTDLIRAEGPLSEHSFTFLRVSDGFAFFVVPKQKVERWYTQKGWPSADKESIVRRIAEKFHLQLHEPPDEYRVSGECHHHFELDLAQEKLIIVHPKYLKFRISRWPLVPEEPLMAELSELYKDENQIVCANSQMLVAEH
jgi:hypothetical protein